MSKPRLSIIMLSIIIVIAISFLIKRQKDKADINQLAVKLANTPAFIAEQKIFDEHQGKVLAMHKKRMRIRWPEPEKYVAFRRDFLNRFGKGIIDTTLNSRLLYDSEAVAPPTLDFRKVHSLFNEWRKQNRDLDKLSKKDRKKVYLKAYMLVRKSKVKGV